jgi:hypothetical protein
MLNILAILISLLGADNDRMEALSPVVNIAKDSSFLKPTERQARITPPEEKAAEFIAANWTTIQAEKPVDILMEGNYSFRREGY